jgi:hypothetical protein
VSVVRVRWRAMRMSGSAVPHKIDLDRARLALLAAFALNGALTKAALGSEYNFSLTMARWT